MRNRGKIMRYDLSVWILTNKSQLPNHHYQLPITNFPKNYAQLNVK
jgi:hypothetical protein